MITTVILVLATLLITTYSEPVRNKVKEAVEFLKGKMGINE